MTNDQQIYRKLNELAQADTPAAVATVIRTKGSVPREVGAKMIIHSGGQHSGTVGGGCGEAMVINAGLEVIDSGQPQTLSVDLSDDISMEAQAVCGGVMEIFVEKAPATAAVSSLLSSLDARNPVALATIVTAKGDFAVALGRSVVFNAVGLTSGGLPLAALTDRVYADIQQILAEGASQILTYAGGDLEIFVEILHPSPQLIIVGAGHVAQSLAPLGKMIDFEVIVMDDRAQYANKARFPTADKIVVGPLSEILGRRPLDSNTFVTLVTRGHSHDVECLLEIIDSPAAYIGMIGSKRRVSAVFELLQKEKGISPQKFKRVHAPIGLDIGAETPAEIAICIIAEIINLYRSGRVASLSDALR